MSPRRNPQPMRLARQGGREPRLLGLFLLGLLLFLPPFLAVFNREATVFGLPLLYLYLFLAWSAFIALIARALRRPPDIGPE
ncbi:MAG: hypothetical protein OEL53_01245 [Rhodospirillales bacterium]|nr:hypothetical protein [Rhodospirillales bacterium]